jgi:hypothetical protein
LKEIEKEEDQEKKWLDMIENDMRAIDVWVGNLENQNNWRFRTKVTNPKYLGERREKKKRYINIRQ